MKPIVLYLDWDPTMDPEKTPMTATNKTHMKWNRSRGVSSVARATRIVTNDTSPIDSSMTMLRLSAARWNVK